MTTNKFYVTEMMEGQKQVAGVRNPGVGKPVELTPAQAEHPLRQGHISKSKPTAKAATKAEATAEPEQRVLPEPEIESSSGSNGRNKR